MIARLTGRLVEKEPGNQKAQGYLGLALMRSGELKAAHAAFVAAGGPLPADWARQLRRPNATVVDVTQFPGGIKGTEGGYVALMDYLVNSVAKALAGGKQ